MRGIRPCGRVAGPPGVKRIMAWPLRSSPAYGRCASIAASRGSVAITAQSRGLRQKGVRLVHGRYVGTMSPHLLNSVTDTLSTSDRSARMALIRSKNTKPEVAVRRLIFGLGFRYRLHVKDLPGKPDLVFRRLHKVIFVHGCFWHRHGAAGCRLARLPKSKLDFWLDKLNKNKARDSTNVRALRKLGWGVLQIWECELSNITKLQRRIERFLQ